MVPPLARPVDNRAMAHATQAESSNRDTSSASRPVSLAPGVGISLVLAVIATVIGRLIPVAGSPVIGIVAGVLLSARLGRRARVRPGIAFASSTVLQVAVVVLGAQLSLREVANVGVGSLPVMVGTMAACLIVAAGLGRLLGIGSDLRSLIGVGTAICGASAIAAVSPIIRAKSPAISYAVSTIFLFNVAAVIAFPPLGRLLGLDQHAFGLFAGTAINDTSSVVAAAAGYGRQASEYAIVVKLTRTLMIIPICLSLASVRRRSDRAEVAPSGPEDHGLLHVARLVPWFLIGFLLVAALNSAGLIPVSIHPAMQSTALFLITVALSAIGLSTDIAAVGRAGLRPLLLGFVLWVTVATTSLSLQTFRM
jgi:uncharacterized integral membrane protein (TIGR00698 family)